MNYRHAFHAGNFADLVKHATLTALLIHLKQDKAPFQVLDTHAGAGAYDLQGDMARKSGEAEAVIKLMADPAAPPVFDALKGAVRALNPKGGVQFYPGSPWLAATSLRRGDSYAGCELRPDDHKTLTQGLTQWGGGKATALLADGFAEAAKSGTRTPRRLILIDPPFEAGSDYQNIVQTVDAALRRDRATIIAIWTPLKDLDTFDRFVGGLERLRLPKTLVAETRLRSLHDPSRLNGCAMVVVGCPPGLDDSLAAAGRWTVAAMGESSGEAKLWRTGG